MKKRLTTLTLGALFVAALALALYPLADTLAQGKSGGNGNKPPGGEESTTNLSYPAYFFGSSLQTGIIGTYDLVALFGGGMSYGCEVPETIGTSTYPNTSCVNSAGEALSHDACLAICAAKDPTKPVERIYWQKNLYNKWQAGYASSTEPLRVKYVDWGDNLESKSWPIQVIRVETNTFSILPDYPDPYGPAENARLRFNLWHVFGQGTNELWGVHASDTDPPVPYVYLDDSNLANWTYGVNVSPTVRLNIAKLENGFPSGGCPATPAGGGSGLSPTWEFDDTSKQGHWAYDENGTPVPVPYFTDFLYGAELNIKGSYVYGYNWNLRSEVVPTEAGKAGWWRLTFYDSDKSIVFDDWNTPSETDNTLAPPPDIATGTLPSVQGGITPAAEADTGPLYVPVVDKTHQLTYIDICVVEGNSGKGGGGGQGGGKKGGK